MEVKQGENQMRKKYLLLLILLLFLTSISGCWSRRELNELAIVSALAFDKLGEDRYLVTAQILNVGELAGEAQTTRIGVSTYEEEGESVFEALRKLTKIAPRKLYLPHLRLVVFSEKLAKEGIDKSLDFLARDHEVRTDFFVVVSKESEAKSILNVLTPMEKNPAVKIYDSIEVSEKAWAPTKGIQLDELVREITAKGDNPVLTGLYIKGDPTGGGQLSNVEKIPSPTMIEIDHLGVFKEDKLVGWLDKAESKGYSYIVDNVTSTVGVMKCKGGNITIEVLKSTTDKKVVVEQGKPKMVIKVEMETSIGEVQCEEEIVNEERIKKLEKEIDQHMTKLLELAIKKAKLLNSDIFGFGEEIHKRKPKIWKKLQNEWDDYGFVDLEVEIEVSSKIRRSGTIQKPYQGKES